MKKKQAVKVAQAKAQVFSVDKGSKIAKLANSLAEHQQKMRLIRGDGLISDLIRVHYAKKHMSLHGKLWSAIYDMFPETKVGQWTIDVGGECMEIRADN